MRTTVAHGNENVALLQFYHRVINFLAVDVHLRFRVEIILAVADENGQRIVVLDKFHFAVFHDVHNRERGIRNAPHRAYR